MKDMPVFYQNLQINIEKHNEDRQNPGPLLTSILFDDLKIILYKEIA